MTVSGVEVSLDNNSWALILEQSMLVLIIIARWLMPKGDLTREQLSALLLNYLGTASDVVDFFSVLSEEQSLLTDMIFVFTIMSVWSWSMIQFIFVVTYTKSDDAPASAAAGNQVAPSDADVEEGSGAEQKQGCARLRSLLHGFVASEMWSIFVSIALQDGPFVVVRLTCIFYWNIRTYTNYFFAFKNFMMLVLQIYRIVAVYQQHADSSSAEERSPIRKKDYEKPAAEAAHSTHSTHHDSLWL